LTKAKRWFAALALLLAAVLAAAGCSGSKSKSLQEILQESIAKSAEIKSYQFSGSLKVEELSVDGNAAEPGMDMVLNMLNGAEISWSGVYQADPMHTEMDLAVALKGDMAITLNIPMVMTQDKMWFKVPSIPFIPLPDDIAGKKFLEIDLKAMAEAAGQPAVPMMDPAKSQQFANDVMNVIFANIDGEQYLSSVKPEDAGVPGDSGVKQVIQFKVDKNQAESFIRTAMEKVLPALLDLFANHAEYREMMGLTPEDIEEAQKGLEAAGAENLDAGLAEFQKAVKSLDVVANLGIDGSGYLVYNDVRAAADFDADGSAVKLAIKLVSLSKDINKEVTLQHPNGPADVITMEELQSRLGAVFGL